ncbi:hypothetical protein PENSPDRAFT_751084 [Peniophora sp. CONT]|nr:hypothetical protein PENSPDRAFT_751084 [Peniophora sp. CONT]
MAGTEADAESYQQAAKDSWSVFIRARFDAGPAGRSGRVARLPQLEAELELMHEFFAIAKQNINSCASIACGLPAEVLAIIFAFAQESWPPKRLKSKQHDLGWIYATHVCASWRKAALGTHTLWQKIDCIALPAPMATDILTRSGRLPLQLYADTENDTKAAIVFKTWMSWPVVRRASLLHIDDNFDYSSGHIPNLWFPILEQSMPLMEDLSITFALEDGPEKLPDNLLAGAQPTLTNLYLQNCCLSNWGVLGGTLTKLSLHMDWLYDEYESLPTMTELRSVFTRSTSLEHISVENFYPKKEPNPPDPFTFYPTLTSLVFHFSLEGAMFESHYRAFWTQFNVPATTSFKLWAYAEVTEYDVALDGFMDPVTRINNTILPAKELLIGVLELTLWCTELPSATLTPPHQLLYTGDSNHYTTRTIKGATSAIKYHLSHLPLESLVSIFVTPNAMMRFDNPEPDGGWLFKLSAARAVRRISVYYTPCQSLLDDLLKKDANDGFALFPLLDTMIFHHRPQAGKMEHQTSLDLVLLELLSDRREHGAGIRELLVDRRMESWFIWSKVDREKLTKLTFFDSTFCL